MSSPFVPPDSLLTGVGHGDFERIGIETAELIRRFAGVKAGERVLDIGSGLGRVTRPLAEILGPEGTYDGIDPVPKYIEWCSNNLGLDPARFRFHHADIYSSFYNPTGAIKPEEYRLPWPDGSFTLVIATSLFTHLSAAACVNYLREIFRVLKPGGRLFASFFVLDGYARQAAKLGTYPSFEHEFEHGLLNDPANPDFAVAFDSEWLLQQFLATGFEIPVFERGQWREPAGPSYQDVVVAKKP